MSSARPFLAFLISVPLLFACLPAEAANIGVYTLAKSVDTSGCSAPLPVTLFVPGDAQVMLWFQVDGTNAGDHPSSQFIDPSGKLYLTTTWQPLAGGGNRCFWASMNISGSSAATRFGRWTIKTYWNGADLFTVSFTLAPSTVRLSTHVVAKSVPSQGCAVPSAAAAFAPSDSRVYSWVLVNGAKSGDDVRTEWVRPDGGIYTKVQFSPLSSSGSLCLWSYVPISGSAAASLNGNWTLNGFWNGVRLYNSRFAIAPAGSIPRISADGVFNAANRDPQQPLVPGELVSIGGANLAARTESASTVPVPASLGGAKVTFNGVPARLVYASPSELVVQVPWIRGDSAEVQVGVNDVWSDPYQAKLAPSSPAVFLDGVAGNGQALAYIFGADGSGKGWMGPNNPAGRGDMVALIVTGLGQTVNPPRTGTNGDPNALPVTFSPVKVSLDNIDAPVLYAGMSGIDDPAWIGSYQVNVRIPAQAPNGAAVPFRLTTVAGDGEGVLAIKGELPKAAAPRVSAVGSSQPAPLSSITISGSGFDPGAAIAVRFYDGRGFSKSVRPDAITPSALTVLVPPYFNSQSNRYTSGSVSIDVLQTVAGQTTTTTAPATVQIQDLPPVNLPAGQLTATVLRAIQHGARETQGILLRQEKTTRGSVSTPHDRAALSQFSQSAAELGRALQKIASNGATVPIVTAEGQTIQLNAAAIHESERLMAAIMARITDTTAGAKAASPRNAESDDCLLPSEAEIQDKAQGRPPAVPYAQRLKQCQDLWAAENKLQLAADISDGANRWYKRTKSIFSMTAAAIGLDTINRQEGFKEAAGFLGLIEAIPIGVQALGQLAATTIAITSGADPEKVAAVLEKTTERQLDVVSDWAGGELLKKGLGLVPVPSDVTPGEANEIKEVISKFGEGWRESRNLIRRRAEQLLEPKVESDSDGNNSLGLDSSPESVEVGGSVSSKIVDAFESLRAALGETAEDAIDEGAAEAASPVYDDGSFMLRVPAGEVGDFVPPAGVLTITGPDGWWPSQMVDLTSGSRNLGQISPANSPAPPPSTGNYCPPDLNPICCIPGVACKK